MSRDITSYSFKYYSFIAHLVSTESKSVLSSTGIGLAITMPPNSHSIAVIHTAVVQCFSLKCLEGYSDWQTPKEGQKAQWMKHEAILHLVSALMSDCLGTPGAAKWMCWWYKNNGLELIIGDQSSNSCWVCIIHLHTNAFGKAMTPSLLSPAMG